MAEIEFQNLFDKYGGVPTITRIVRDFFQRILADVTLRRYFDGVDHEQLIQHQIELIAYTMGRPASTYDTARLRVVHQPRRISLTAYERVVAILRQVLLDAQVEGQDIVTIIDSLDAHRDKIVANL